MLAENNFLISIYAIKIIIDQKILAISYNQNANVIMNARPQPSLPNKP